MRAARRSAATRRRAPTRAARRSSAVGATGGEAITLVGEAIALVGEASTLVGEAVALVGPTGCGKSSCMSLLQRLYDPSKGAILLDGIELPALDVRHLRSRVVIVDIVMRIIIIFILMNIIAIITIVITTFNINTFFII